MPQQGIIGCGLGSRYLKFSPKTLGEESHGMMHRIKGFRRGLIIIKVLGMMEERKGAG